MSVGIKDLEGFGFIYQPTEFDAAFCSYYIVKIAKARNNFRCLQDFADRTFLFMMRCSTHLKPPQAPVTQY